MIGGTDMPTKKPKLPMKMPKTAFGQKAFGKMNKLSKPKKRSGSGSPG